jgi:hypothetical protein
MMTFEAIRYRRDWMSTFFYCSLRTEVVDDSLAEHPEVAIAGPALVISTI